MNKEGEKVTRKLAYQLYSVRHPDEVDYRLFMPGLFQWPAAFELYGRLGEMKAHIQKEELERHDIVHVNYTPTNSTYLSALRNELGNNSSVVLAANVDFALMMWNRIDPLVMIDQLKKADFIFHVESYGAARLRNLLDRNVYTIPHPSNTEELKMGARSGGKPNRLPIITCQYHRYEDTWADYFYGLQKIRSEYDIEIILMNYESPKGEIGPKVPVIAMFNQLNLKYAYRDYVRFLANAMINVDITYDFTYGRGLIDAAALGIPTVGSNTIEAQRKIWPDLAIRPGGDNQMYSTVKRLIDSDDSWEKYSKDGMDGCNEYSLENSYNKMVEALETEGLV